MSQAKKFSVLKRRGFKFLAAGVLNSIFGFVVFGIASYAGAKTWQALLCSNAAGIIFNFYTIGGVVFRDMSRNSFFKFVTAYGMLFFVNIKCIEFLAPILSNNRVSAQALLTPPMATLSYITMSFWVFANKARNK